LKASLIFVEASYQASKGLIMKKFDNNFFFLYRDQLDKNKYWRHKIFAKTISPYNQFASNCDRFEKIKLNLIETPT
jgi:hypothetical protein